MKLLLIVGSCLLGICLNANANNPPPINEAKYAIDENNITVEIADTPYTLEQGLMFRKHLDKNKGMLLVLPQPQNICVWARNVEIPLSAAFIDDFGRVINMVDLEPFSEEKKCANQPVKYILETNRDWFYEHNITPGSMFRRLYDY